MAMQYPRYLSLILALMLAALGASALAQEAGETVVYMGELNLLANPESGASFSSGAGPVEALGGSVLAQATASNNSSLNLTNNTMINATAVTDQATVDLAAAQLRNLAPSSGKEVIDLSRYARDRVNNSLAGYTNIMYPITGSRGTTTSTSGGGGGGGGCGCG